MGVSYGMDWKLHIHGPGYLAGMAISTEDIRHEAASDLCRSPPAQFFIHAHCLPFQKEVSICIDGYHRAFLRNNDNHRVCQCFESFCFAHASLSLLVVFHHIHQSVMVATEVLIYSPQIISVS